MANYRRVIIDLATAADRAPIDRNVAAQQAGTAFKSSQVEFVTVLQAPPGTGLVLHIGDGAEPLDLLPPGTTYEMCPPEDTGIYYSVPAGGGQVVLMVSFQAQAVGVG